MTLLKQPDISPTKTYYTWKVWSEADKTYRAPLGYKPPRYDFLFDSPDDAKAALNDWGMLEDAAEEKWLLFKTTRHWDQQS